MNFLTKTLTALLATAFTSAPVMATPSYFQDHVTLMAAVESVGVRVYVNSSHCDNANFYGFYRALGSGMMVICQEGRVTGSQEMVPWSEEDLDTLRHESHHLVQDCAAGVKGDALLGNIFNTKEELYNFIYPILGEKGINAIINAYGSAGDEVILLELEAFAVSDSIGADRIAQAVVNTCSR